jgi:pyruvate,water dikinase
MSAREDDLYSQPSDELHWSITNFGEVIPGVQTPLSSSLWRAAVDYGGRRSGYEIGALSRAESRGELPAPVRSPLLRAFHGRHGFQVEFMMLLGDRMPGIDGFAVVEDMFGYRPLGIESQSTRRRYPVIAARLPYLFATVSARIGKEAVSSRRWHASSIHTLQTADRATAIGLLTAADAELKRALAMQATATLGMVQPLFQGVGELVRRTGVGDVGAFSGSGSPEVAELIGDLWKASRGRLGIETVLARHGYHGPLVGEASSCSWREDPKPLERLIERYRCQPDSADPDLAEAANQARRRALTAELLATLPAVQRPAVRAFLGLAAARIPLRGAAKEAMSRAIDVARAATRRIGHLLAHDGVLQDAEDAFYLTLDELLREQPPPGCPALVHERRRRRDECLQVTLPKHWSGEPEVIHLAAEPSATVARVEGVGVSRGVLEGTARVIEHPDFAEVEDGEILVAAYTDPGWASIMFVASALVVDLGGALSHAAVVARELGIPCVVNTGDGTRRIRTGDRIRVDGDDGTVDILERRRP